MEEGMQMLKLVDQPWRLIVDPSNKNIEATILGILTTII